MNAPANIKPDNLAIWNALGKTDPKHTKQFKRAGGFSGTALKPIWVERQLTEQFGPCGIGWGNDEPQFQLVTVGDEILVYCILRAWHTAPDNSLWGVGGDKVAAKNKFGLQADDEAFKKAYTDALMNAFKHIGVGADIHMGQFDDSKYVAQVTAEFAEGQSQGDSQGKVGLPQPITDEQVVKLQSLMKASKANPTGFNQFFKIKQLPDLPADRFSEAEDMLNAKLKKLVDEETNKEAANA